MTNVHYSGDYDRLNHDLWRQDANAVRARQGDQYPSRCRPYPDTLPRLDPVVYGDPKRCSALTAEQLKTFEKDGFLVLDGFFSPGRVAAWREEMFALSADPELQNREEVIAEPQSRIVRSIFRVHELSHTFASLARDPVLLDIVQTILGDDVYVHQSRVNYKPGFRGKEFYWHSDFETWHVEDGMPRMRAVSISIALSENNEFNGPLMLIPGSHHTFVSCVGETPDDHYKSSLRAQEFGIPDNDTLSCMVEKGGIVAPKGPPGTVTIFDCNTMHGSNGNISPFPRSNAFFVYNACSNRLCAPFGARKPRPSFIASRHDKPLRHAG